MTILANRANPRNGHRTITPEEAAAALGISISTVYRYAASHLGGIKRFGRWELDADLVAAHATGGAS